MANEKRSEESSASWERTHLQERVNALTHGAGLVLSLVGALVMAMVVLPQGDFWRVTGCGLYLVSLVGVYAASTLSHSFHDRRWRRFFRALDQGFIYLLIVGTYTPFSLVYLRTWPWWLLLGAMWSVAVFGFLSKLFFLHRVDAVSIWIYLTLGWVPIISATSLIGVVPDAALWWMLAGGLCYTLGTIFLINDERFTHFHAIWHLMVIAGSVCHFVAILFFVAPVVE